ncbi:MAG: multiheme c-type cytochrome [Proteobacteria bacterium]|nr:multiheme c-type cytochrome [Pseudomonadota bacterium]
MEPARTGNSAQCGACHAQIAKEWQASIHSQAGSDQTYQKNVNLLAKKKGMATTRYCEGCHAPVALISGQMDEGWLEKLPEDNPRQTHKTKNAFASLTHRTI